MKLFNKNGLLTRLTVTIIFTAIAVGFIVSEVFYRITYKESIEDAKEEINLLYKTVASTSSMAAFLSDQELANEVLTGLMANQLILAVKIETDTLYLTQGKISATEPIHTFQIKSPFEGNSLGEISLTQNSQYIKERADLHSQHYVQALIIQSFIITLVSIYIVHVMISKPLSGISTRLNGISPPSSERLNAPNFHQFSELGSLINNVNLLLEKTEHALNHELQYRKEIQQLEQRFRLTFEGSASPIILTDFKGNLLLSNFAFSALLDSLNMKMQKNFGLYLCKLFRQGDFMENNLTQQLQINEIASGEFCLLEQNNQDNERWYQIIVSSIIADDYKEYLQITFHDVSKKRTELKRLADLIEIDPLTKVLNRTGIMAKLDLLALSSQEFALVFIDLNNFKPINDEYGHAVGDEILVHISQSLANNIRKEDFVCRWGGDEFIVLLPNVHDGNVEKLLTLLKNAISAPLYSEHAKRNFSIDFAAGVAYYPHTSSDPMDVLHEADQAMYESKKQIQTNPELFYTIA